MKKSILIASVALCTSVFAVDGYKDIYIKSNTDVYIHTIYCAKDLTNIAALRPSIVYTNTKDIEDGTYYVDSNFGKYSTTFNQVKGKSTSLRVRGILTKGQTTKKQMKKELCLVKKSSELPKNLNGRIKQDFISGSDSSWNQKMKKYMNFYGKPAYAKDKYLSIK